MDQYPVKRTTDPIQEQIVCNQAVELISLISNETRLRILCVLSQGDFCVSEIAEKVGGKNSNISQQLKILTLAGCLNKRRMEKSMIYSLTDERIRRVLEFLKTEFGGEH